MQIELDFEKSVEQNAERLFDTAKKAKKKRVGLQTAMAALEKELEKEKQKQAASIQSKKIVLKRKREWFEKFRWFKTSDDLLVIGGRDAKSNEEVVKKFLEDSDLFFHADVVGAPHCALKTKNNAAPKQSKSEAAQFAAVFSRAWQSGATQADAYCALPSQVTKQAQSGEFVGKGAFMVYGEREWFKKTPLLCAVGIEKIGGDYRVICGPLAAVKKHAVHFVELVPGGEEKNAVAKKLFRLFSEKTLGQSSILLEDVQAALPSGASKMVLQK